MYIQWGRLHTLWVLHSMHQQHVQVVPLHVMHLYTCKDKTNQAFLLYGGRQHFLEQRSWIVYLRGWSDKLICVLDLARAGVALVCQIE
jgi:hypothetical protein